MCLDRVFKQGPLALESDVLPTVVRGLAYVASNEMKHLTHDKTKATKPHMLPLKTQITLGMDKVA